MLRRSLVCALVLCCATVASADFVSPGLSLVERAPPIQAGSTTTNVMAVNPVTNDLWWSAGQTLHRLDGGSWDAPVDLRQSAGGPIASNSVTSRLAFDSAGRMYVADFLSGGIFRSADAGSSWDLFASVPRFVDDFHFDSAGNLVVFTDGQRDGLNRVWSIDPNGSVDQLGEIYGRTFTFDGAGNVIAPHESGNGIDRLTPDGVRSTVLDIENDIVSPWEFLSIAVSPSGDYLLAANLGVDTSTEEWVNRSQIWLVDSITGSRSILIGNEGGPIPADMQWFGDTLYIAAFGSLHALALNGIVAVPEPSTLSLTLIAVGSAFVFRRRRAAS